MSRTAWGPIRRARSPRRTRFTTSNASPIVPLGYPFFLKIVGARGAIVAQPILFGAALAFLGREIVRLTRSTWLAVAVVAGSMLLPQIREFHASILSESLFLSLLVVFLALSVRFAYHPTWHLMVLDRHDRRPQRHRSPHRLRARAGHAGDGAAGAPPAARARSRRSFFVAALAPFLVDRRRRAGGRAGRARRPLIEPDGPSHVRQGGADRCAARAPPAASRSGAGRARSASASTTTRRFATFLASAPPRSPRRAVDLLRDVPAGRLRRSIAGADAGPRTKPNRPRRSASAGIGAHPRARRSRSRR